MRSLKGGRPVAGLTLPGHGAAPSPPESAGFEDCVDLLARQVRSAFPPETCVAGYSMGARVALGLLIRHPGLFAEACLVGVNPGIGTEEERRERKRWEGKWVDLLTEGSIDRFVDEWERLPLFATQNTFSYNRLQEQRKTRLRHDPLCLAASLRSLGLAGMPDYRPNLREISIPVRFITGERDDRFLAIARESARSIPNALRSEIPKTGHNPLLENPEALARVLASR